jgi:Ca-activated chloride channel family protein
MKVAFEAEGRKRLWERSFKAHLVSALLGCSCLVITLVPVTTEVSLAQQKTSDQRSDSVGQRPPILLRVAVTDAKVRLIANLKRDAFTVFDGDVAQTISSFADDDVPSSVGFLIDTSGSMKYGPTSSMIKDSILRFIQQGNRANEYFALTYGATPEILIDWTRDVGLIEDALNKLDHLSQRSATAVYDACHLAIEKVRTRSNPKHALILITDGQDTASHHSYAAVRESLKRSDAIVYAVYAANGIDQYSGLGARFLREILSYSGGTGFPADSKADMLEAFDFFAQELRHQYLIGYSPARVDPEWHSVKVKVNTVDIVGLPKSNKQQKLTARTRQGYYASEHIR